VDRYEKDPSSVALLGLTAGATAADLLHRTVVAPTPVIPVPVFTWTGFYIGVNAGGAFTTNNNELSYGPLLWPKCDCRDPESYAHQEVAQRRPERLGPVLLLRHTPKRTSLAALTGQR
jgi:hypothetical protein